MLRCSSAPFIKLIVSNGTDTVGTLPVVPALIVQFEKSPNPRMAPCAGGLSIAIRHNEVVAVKTILNAICMFFPKVKDVGIRACIRESCPTAGPRGKREERGGRTRESPIRYRSGRIGVLRISSRGESGSEDERLSTVRALSKFAQNRKSGHK